MKEIEIEQLQIEKLIPYARNSRTHSDEQVAQIASSIREFGFTNPVLIDSNDGIIAGHGRVMAARKLNMTDVPCIRLGHLTETQKRAYIIADNKLALNSGWDEEMLGLELVDLREADFDLGLIGFDAEGIEAALNPPEIDGENLNNDYTHKVEAPVYEPKGECPNVTELADYTKYDQLVSAISNAKLPKDVSDFLKSAATRHLIFDYGKIAEFYCHSNKEIQSLMEDSALIIIDFKKAMQLGYVKLQDEISNLILSGEEDNDEE